MRRRDFLRLLASGVVGSHIDVDRLLWEPNKKTIFLPTAKQIEFYNTAQSKLWGIPYHQSNASMGAWLGISRSGEAYEQLGKLVKLLEDDKKNDLQRKIST